MLRPGHLCLSCSRERNFHGPVHRHPPPSVGFFFGDNEDSTSLFDVEAATVKDAVSAAQANLIKTWEFEAHQVESVGGADEVMPALYVFAGHRRDMSGQEADSVARW